MAVKTFEEVVASLQLSADEKKIFDNAIAKSPELKEGWLRQDDYSRKSTEFQAKQKKFEDLEAYQARMEPWSDEAHKRINRAVEAGVMDAEGNSLWEQKEADYKRQIAAAAVGGEMDPAELEKRVKEIVAAAGGQLSREELKALWSSEGKKLAEETFNEQWKTKETDFNTKTIPVVAGFAAGVSVFASKYEKETGEQWTEEKAKELFDRMGKENNFNAYQVGDQMLAPFRDKKKLDEEVEKRVQERMKQFRMPGGGEDEFIPQRFNEQKGNLQLALERSTESKDFQAIIDEQVVKAGKDLVQDGKF